MGLRGRAVGREVGRGSANFEICMCARIIGGLGVEGWM